jgi:hypothetical protein
MSHMSQLYAIRDRDEAVAISGIRSCLPPARDHDGGRRTRQEWALHSID